MHYSIYKTFLDEFRKDKNKETRRFEKKSNYSKKKLNEILIESLKKVITNLPEKERKKMCEMFETEVEYVRERTVYFLSNTTLVKNLINCNIEKFNLSLLPKKSVFSIAIPQGCSETPSMILFDEKGIVVINKRKEGDFTTVFPFDKLNDLSEIKDANVKLAISTLLYIHSMPNRVVKGLPSYNKKDFPHQINLENNIYTVSMPKTTKNQQVGKSEHYRKWSFRQLTHPKYYKGEFKNDTIGSRVVFVQDCIVNRVINPKTVLENH
jgi:hypothetical protein